MDDCIRKGILANILRGNRAEVTDMLLKEYDEAFHIANEKEISYEEGYLEGQLKERENTERERKRAEEIQKQMDVLKYRLQNKSNEEISKLTQLSLEQIESILVEVIN